MIRSAWLGEITVLANEWQTKLLAERRIRDEIPDQLRIFTYPPTFTFRQWNRDHRAIRDQAAFLQYARRHAALLIRTHRGGGLIYHGPGQLLVSPIIKLRPGFGIPEYASALEETMIRFLRDHFNVSAFRVCYDRQREIWCAQDGGPISLFNETFKPGTHGAWIRDGNGVYKIGFLGSRLDRGVVRHGFALNLCPDLEAFRFIDPCNLPGIEVSSVEHLTGIRPALTSDLARAITEKFVSSLPFPTTFSFTDET